MKRLKIAVIALFALVTVSNVNAQDSENPWVFGLGTNTVDFYDGGNFGDQVTSDLFETSDWNFMPSISRITADRYLGKGFSVQLAGSINKISKFSKNYAIAFGSEVSYVAVNANVKYDLNNWFGETGWFDPFVNLGLGYGSLNSNGDATWNVGFGFNTWFNDNFGLNFQHATVDGFKGNMPLHYQNSVGIVVKFGAKDADKDGINDADDACPEVAGLAEFNGCPDADGDGVKDSDDACPNTPGLAELNGCPDADGDGVADKDDLCPNTKGSKANNGCPDADGDGVVDKDDKCVNVAGPAENNGCPWLDTDGDGVLDKDDKCANVAGLASNNGCPAITDEAAESLKAYAKSILFNLGSSSFKSGISAELDAIAQVMNKFDKSTFAIEGHTDSTGSVSINTKLSQARATAVMNYLISKGVSSSRLTAKGFASEYPVSSNNTSKGRAENRRVEIKRTN